MSKVSDSGRLVESGRWLESEIRVTLVLGAMDNWLKESGSEVGIWDWSEDQVRII